MRCGGMRSVTLPDDFEWRMEIEAMGGEVIEEPTEAEPEDERNLSQLLQDSRDVFGAAHEIPLDHAIATLREREDEHQAAGREDLAFEYQVAAGKLSVRFLDERYYPRMVRYWAQRWAEEERDRKALQAELERLEAEIRQLRGQRSVGP